MTGDLLAHRLPAFFGREYALLTGRATAGLYLLLKALGLRRAHVLVPGNVCYTVPLAVLRSGNVPVFCDISLEHYGVTADTLGAALTPKTRAVVLAHMYGIVGDVEGVSAWCRGKGLHLIEDAALALGGRANGRAVGSLGDSTLLSFGSGKIVDCQVGGLLLTDDARLHREAARVQQSLPPFREDVLTQVREFGRLYRELRPLEKLRPGIDKVYAALFDLYPDAFFFRPEPGWATRMWDGLRDLDEQREIRGERASLYERGLQHPWLIKPSYPAGGMVWRYSFRCLRNRDLLLARLRRRGMHASSWYPSVDRIFAERNPHRPSPCPRSDTAEGQIVNLWVDSSVSDEDIQTTVDAVRLWLDEQPARHPAA